jgi:hypothetical protein
MNFLMKFHEICVFMNCLIKFINLLYLKATLSLVMFINNILHHLIVTPQKQKYHLSFI